MIGNTFELAIERHHDALVEFMHGDAGPFKDLYTRSDDATLANPFGGVARGWDEISGRIDRAASYYHDGKVMAIEPVVSYSAGDLGYTVEIERLHARVGAQTVFDEVALRTTSVFRREHGEWRLVHRHADPRAELQPTESII